MIKREPPSYLFGTIHVPYTKVWDHIPDNAKQAFAISSHVYFELDLVNPTTVSALSTCQMLPQGKNLSDVLPGNLYTLFIMFMKINSLMPSRLKYTPTLTKEKIIFILITISIHLKKQG